MFITIRPRWHLACGVPIRLTTHRTLRQDPAHPMALREFNDHAGRRWLVWDVHPAPLRTRDGRPSGGYNPPARLAFECKATGERRRLMPIPDGWDAYTDAELGALLQRAERLPTR